MSFNNNGFGPFDGSASQPFWQLLLLVAVPAFVGACLPPVIAHVLERSKTAPPAPAAPETVKDKPVRKRK
jgi:hypothetical protein